MVGNYGQTGKSLEMRQPAHIFAPIAWLLAGPLNPMSFFAFQLWGLHFDLVSWIILVGVPLSLGAAIGLFFLRDGGFGFATLAMLVTLSSAVGCAIAGPLFTVVLWYLQEWGIWYSGMPLYSLMGAVGTSGTFIRSALLLTAAAVIPAIVFIRLIAFQREKPKKKAVAAP